MATERTPQGITVHGRTPSSWAESALFNAMTRAANKATEAEAAITLQRGIRTAGMWLDGSHPKLNV